MRRCLVLAAVGTLSFTTDASAGKPVVEGVSWLRTPDDDLGRPYIERLTGRTASELAAGPSHWEGDMLFTPEGLGASALAAMGMEPLHAMSYEPSPGVLYIEMGGVTLTPTCGNGDGANAALNCSPLVDAETNFPAYGNGTTQASMFQELQNYYEPFNIVMSANRPPDWLPFTMAVIGGASNQGQGVCGVANVACDGLKRNHVSLTFPQSCNGVAEIAAQETSHNWGLEHTDDTTDLMYPFANGGFKTYVDTCNDISHATGNGVTQCGYIHELHCPAGEGEQQNSYQELMGVFGPREVDTTAPQIVSITPEDGAVVSMSDSVTVSARVEENSRMIGAKWTWVAGELPDGATEYTRCTNNVCTVDFDPGPSFDPNEMQWDFVNLQGAPIGSYTFKFEVMDAYGNYDSEEITIEVTEDGNSSSDPDTGNDTGDGSAEDDGTGDGTGEDDGEDDDGEDDDGGDTGATLVTAGADDGGGGKEACACTTDGGAPRYAMWMLGLGALGLRRRRR
jgi:MYXO-CTERM domain-containing protein